MCGEPSTRRPRRTERGAVSWVSLVLLAVLVGGGYLAWVWVPLYYDNYAVRQVVADYMNQAVKSRDDADLRARLVQSLEQVAVIDGVDAAGRPAKLPAISVDERDIAWDRDDATRTLHVSFGYARQVVYPYLGRTDVKVFAIDM